MFFDYLQAKEIKRFDFDLFIDSVHGLFYFEVIFEKHAELGEEYKELERLGREAEASLCFAK